MVNKADERRDNFKNKKALQVDENRSRRQLQTVEIRKQKREDNLTKRRTMAMGDRDMSDSDEDLDKGENDVQLHEKLQSLLTAIASTNVEDQLNATTAFRKLLSKEKNPPIEQVINTGVVPRFVEFLSSPHNIVQFEAAWALTNIASGSSAQTQVVVNYGAIPQFVQLLRNNVCDVQVQEQAVWALGNIAGDSPAFRDAVLNAGVLQPLLDILNNSPRYVKSLDINQKSATNTNDLDNNQKNTMISNATWTLSNLCRGKSPRPDWNMVKGSLPTLAQLVYSDDDEVIVDSCWALSYLSDNDNEKIQYVIDSGVCGRLVELLTKHASPNVLTPALRCVGNIVTGDDMQTQIIINLNVLPALRRLCGHKKESLQKEACWTISNITAGTMPQIQAVIDCDIIPALVYLLDNGASNVKKEACWAIANATSGGENKLELIHYLAQQNCIMPLCKVLIQGDNKIIKVALDGLENILKAGEMMRASHPENINPYALHIEECGGLDSIHELQHHDNEDIHKIAYRIVLHFFTEDEEVGIAESQGDFNFNNDLSMPEGGFHFG